MTVVGISLLLLLFGVHPAITNVFRFYLQPPAVAMVTQLVEGRIDRIQQGSVLVSSVTLVEDGGYYIVVDSPSATDLTSKELMLKGLMSRNLVPGQMQMIVTTHGHPDHFGQGNFFPNARHFFASYEYTGTTFIRTELYQAETMKLTKNTELWNTPGHTSQDVSLIVRNTKCCGTIAIVGDLFYSESDAIDSREWDLDAWDRATGHQNRRRIICEADWIIPGHGKMFKVTNPMREASKCDILLAQRTKHFNSTENSPRATNRHPLPEAKEPAVALYTEGNQFPLDNSILLDNERSENEDNAGKSSLTHNSENVSKKPEINGVEKNQEMHSMAKHKTTTPMFQIQPSSMVNNRPEMFDMLPVTSAQDITQFQGTDKELFKQPSNYTSKTANNKSAEDSFNDGTEIVGSVIYPTKSVAVKTPVKSVVQEPPVSKTAWMASVKRFDKLFNPPTTKNSTYTVSVTPTKKPEGIIPVLESAANQIASLFGDKTKYSTSNSVSYIKLIEKAINKLLSDAPEKSPR